MNEIINVTVIAGTRQSGRTTELIKETVKDPLGILVCDRGMTSVVYKQMNEEAQKLKIKHIIAYPLSYQEFITGQYDRKYRPNIYIDNIEMFIKRFLNYPSVLKGYTMRIDFVNQNKDVFKLKSNEQSNIGHLLRLTTECDGNADKTIKDVVSSSKLKTILRDRIIYHADETKYRYELGKGIMDYMIDDLTNDISKYLSEVRNENNISN